MGRLVYDKQGNVRAELSSLRYEGIYKSSRQLEVSVYSPMPIDWEIGDYIDYRGERFTLRSLPTAKKTARKESRGDAFEYSSVIFHSHLDELTTTDMLDVVEADNLEHYSSLPKFSFWCDRIEALVSRMQANLDRVYSGDERWTITVVDGAEIEPQQISFSQNKVSDALSKVAEMGLDYHVKGRTITIGAKGIVVSQAMMHGKGQGLKALELQADDQTDIITRLRVYGSAENLPHRYYNKLYKNAETGEVKYFKDAPSETVWVLLISESMYLPNLMLPSMRETGNTDPYIEDAEAMAKYGVREGNVYFDGSGDNVKIMPSMEGMTAEDLALGGIEVSVPTGDNGNLDEIYEGSIITDNGMLPEDGELAETEFTVVVKNIGFDLNDYLTEDTARIEMKSGMCGGRGFEIVKCEQEVLTISPYSGGYVLTCKREADNDLDLAFPNSTYQIKAGDKFVLTGIDLPEVYILAASQRLLKAGTEYLSNNNETKRTATPEIDSKLLAENPDIANELVEGNRLVIIDEDLGIEQTITISQLEITEGEADIAEYKVTLSDGETVTLAQRVTQSVVSELKTNKDVQTISNSQILAVGKTEFLSKRKADEAQGHIGFKQGLSTGTYVENVSGANVDAQGNAEVESMKNRGDSEVKGRLSVGERVDVGNWVQGSSGASIWVDELGKVHMQLAYLTIDNKATFAEIEVQEMSHTGGWQLLSPAGARITEALANTGGGYMCYFKRTDGDRVIENPFKVDDLVRCQTFDLENGNRYYWRKCIAVGNQGEKNYIILSETDCDPNTTNDAPIVGDSIVTLGNKSDTSRQSAIMLKAYGEGSPAIIQYTGISDYTLAGCEVTRLSPGGNVLQGTLKVESGKAVEDLINEGDAELSTRIEATENEIILQAQNITALSESTSEIKQTADSVDVRVSTLVAGYENMVQGTDGKEDHGWTAYPITTTTILNTASAHRLGVQNSITRAFGAYSPALKLKQGKTYTMSWTGTVQGMVNTPFIRIYSASKGTLVEYSGNSYFNGTRQTVQATCPYDLDDVSVRFGCNGSTTSGAMCAVFVDELMVEDGTTAHDWIAYGDNLRSAGVNITDKTITLSAERTKVVTESGDEIAVFTTDEAGNPVIQTSLIDLNPLTLTKGKIPTIADVQGIPEYYEFGDTVQTYSSTYTGTGSPTLAVTVTKKITITGAATGARAIVECGWGKEDTNKAFNVSLVGATETVTVNGTTIEKSGGMYVFALSDSVTDYEIVATFSVPFIYKGGGIANTGLRLFGYIRAPYGMTTIPVYPTTLEGEQQTIVGANGMMSVNGGHFVFHVQHSTEMSEDGTEQPAGITMLVGNYGERITASGIQKTTNGGLNWG